MDFFFCIPIIFGCPTKIKPDGGHQEAHICPRCHNAQCIKGSSRTWFEVCWIPLIPFKKKHIYICGICQWQAPQDGQYQPPVAGGGPGYAAPPQGHYPPKPQ